MSLSKLYVHKQVDYLYDLIISQEMQLKESGTMRPAVFFQLSSRAYLAGPMLKPVLGHYLQVYQGMSGSKKTTYKSESDELMRAADALLWTAKGEKDDLLKSINEL